MYPRPETTHETLVRLVAELPEDRPPTQDEWRMLRDTAADAAAEYDQATDDLRDAQDDLDTICRDARDMLAAADAVLEDVVPLLPLFLREIDDPHAAYAVRLLSSAANELEGSVAR